jgi:hypothetical protein
MNFSEYLRYDGLGLAELVAQKQIHPAELLQIAIERSQQTNPALNAIIIPKLLCLPLLTFFSNVFHGESWCLFV